MRIRMVSFLLVRPFNKKRGSGNNTYLRHVHFKVDDLRAAARGKEDERSRRTFTIICNAPAPINKSKHHGHNSYNFRARLTHQGNVAQRDS